ncbi:MAG: DNA methyltransferase [Rhodobacteraceae bacterium]|nr:DNA methyltransferase [Paracoccaceae bacterium]
MIHKVTPPPPNWANRTLFHGDNLPIMRGMNSESVDLIATDPPFNKGRDFHATPDSLAAGARFQDRWSWERDVHESWTDQITDDYPRLMEAIESARYAHSDGMGAYMCFMAVRLLEMRRILKPTGSIYLHCDPTASHYLKACMDAIFGWKNFRNEIVWERIQGAGKRSQYAIRSFGRSTDTIFLYSRGNDYTFNANDVALPYPDISSSFPCHDDKGRFKRRSPFRPPGLGPRPNLVYDYKGIAPPHSSGWTVSKGKLQELDEAGEIEWVNGVPWRKQRPAVGIIPNNVWKDIPTPAKAEKSGYATQKPLALYERIVKAGSNPGNTVLDPFCGCATTLVASEQSDRQWVGMDIWEGAHDVVIDRMRKVIGPLFGDVHYTKEPPTRTDDGETAAPFLRVKQKVKEPEGPRWTRAEMYAHLLDQHGPRCAGCDRLFDDPRYLELDHNTPRSDGGLNHISNRILLCGPCNRLKSNTFTLSGLRRENRKRGYMKGVEND